MSGIGGTGASIQPLFNTSVDGTPLGPTGEPLPPAVQPPPGSITKLAPNATLIDLNKIKKDHDGEKPFKIDQVTVLIDESDDVKVRRHTENTPRITLTQCMLYISWFIKGFSFDYLNRIILYVKSQAP